MHVQTLLQNTSELSDLVSGFKSYNQKKGYKKMCICLICQTSIAIPKKGNVERHFRTVYKKYKYDCAVK